MKLRGPYQPSRGLAIGKTVYVKVLRGQLIACKWPRRRPRVTNPTTLEQMERFRQANWMAKYAAPEIQIAHRRLVDGTQLLPRDLMVAAMLGRGLTTALPGEQRRYPVAAIRDLSDTLDILGAQPSDVLGRGPDLWQALHATQAGQALISGAPGQAPSWQTLSGGGGMWQLIEDVTLAVALGIGVYRQVTIPPNAQEIEYDIHLPNLTLGCKPVLRLNQNNGANYFQQLQGLVTGPDVQGIAITAATEFRLAIDATVGAAFRFYCRGRIWQPNPAERVFISGDANYGGTKSTRTNGQWVPPSSQVINSLGFASTVNQGLMVGTRIIVRAAIP